MAVQKYLLILSLGLFAGCSLFSSFSADPIVDELIVNPSPNGHQQFIEAINNAKKSIQLKMFHLSDPAVAKALLLAHQRKIDVQIILDNGSLEDDKFQKIFSILTSGGVNIRKSSTCFSITHEKSMIIDQKSAFITSINLTRTTSETRDFGVITTDKEIIKEMESVFLADWENAVKNTCYTPPVKNPLLIWSPVNAETKLIALIHTAQDSLSLTVENLGNQKIEQALNEMASHGVEVKLIVPQCDRNKNPFYNYPFIKILSMANVQVKVMPHPSGVQYPYMHSKMILVDKRIAYIGSINFSNNSMLKARELGIIFSGEKTINKISEEFDRDWSVSITPVPLKFDFCPVFN